MPSRLALLAALASALCGCLHGAFVVSHAELMRLAQLPPQHRWQAVRATERVGGSERPPDSDDDVVARESPVVAHPPYGSDVPPHDLRLPVIAPPSYFHTHVTGIGNGSSTIGEGGGGTHFGGSVGGGSHGGGLGGGDGRGLAAIVVVLIPAAIVAATVVTVTLIASEGLRYDGWIAVSPDEPLYLRYEDGSRAEIALSDLSPEIANAANDAELYEGPESRFPRLLRAPLDRVGPFFATGLHVTGIPLASRIVAGTGAHIALGVFPIRWLGFALTGDALAAIDASAYAATVGGEIQTFPVRWVGLYGGASYAARWTMSPAPGGPVASASDGWIVRAGIQAEAPITTRWSVHFRAGGVASDFGDGAVHIVPETTVGFSIY